MPTGFGGAQPNSGRKPKPRPREVLERFIAEEGERLGQAYFGVLLEGMRSSDEQVRIRAAVELGNRLWGRPAQAVELSGAVESLMPAGRLAVESESVRRLADAVRDELMARDARPVRSSG
jgi:HEAT repeat protein